MKQAKYKTRLAFESRVEVLINIIGVVAFVVLVGLAMELVA